MVEGQEGDWVYVRAVEVMHHSTTQHADDLSTPVATWVEDLHKFSKAPGAGSTDSTDQSIVQWTQGC
jgi:hypothetical protein